MSRRVHYEPRHAQGVGKHRLVEWRRPRVSRAVFGAIVGVLAVLLVLAGALAARMIPDDLMAAYVAGTWGVLVGCAALAVVQR